MPFSVKASIAVTILSSLTFILSIHFDKTDLEISGFIDRTNLVFGIFWCLCMGWIISNILRKKDERLMLVILGAICAFFIIPETSFNIQNMFFVFSTIEVALFFLAAYLLNRPESKAWRSS